MRVMIREEFGVWIVLGNSTIFLALLNFGVPTTLTRHIAMAKGRSGADPHVELSGEVEQHIADLVVTGRTVLRILAVATSIAAFGIGCAFLYRMELRSVSHERTVLAWLIICVGFAIGVWVSYLECWMAGVGFLGWNALIIASVAVATLIANITAALLGGGLISLASILVAGNLLQRALFLVAIRRSGPRVFQIRGQWNSQYARNLIHPSLNAWMLALGAFLVAQTAVYFIGIQNAAEVPAYQAANSLMVNLYALASTLAVTSTVFLSQAWQARDFERVRRHTVRLTQIGMTIMAAGVGFVLVAGREFIELWLGKSAFIGYEILLVFCITFTLEAHSVILLTCARSTEDERYAISALTAGALNLVLTWILIGPLGLLGVALSTMIAQILTNHWYGVYRPFVRLKINPREYFRRVVLLWLITLGGTVGIGWILTRQLRESGFSAFWQVGVALAIAGLALCGALWCAVIEPPQRQQLLSRFRRTLRISS